MERSQSKAENTKYECCLDSFSYFVFLGFGLRSRGSKRVRTRNTLHEAGARKSLICYDAVERRKRKRKRKWVKVKKRKYDKMLKNDKCRNIKILKKVINLIKQKY